MFELCLFQFLNHLIISLTLNEKGKRAMSQQKKNACNTISFFSNKLIFLEQKEISKNQFLKINMKTNKKYIFFKNANYNDILVD